MAKLRAAAVMAATVASFGMASAANAVNVTFVGAVTNLCVLTLSTPGLLGVSSDGTLLSSKETAGISAILAVVSTGTNPTINFTAPALSGPSASTSGAITQIAYTSSGGASQTYTSSTYSYVMNRLLDTMTIDAKATNSSGFTTGTYTISTTATCSQ